MNNSIGQKLTISGIYKIICINDKFYIGSSVNIEGRLKYHIRFLKRNKHTNKRLQKAWNEYGEKNFRFEIVEIIYDVKQLQIREKWWIYNTGCCNKRIGFNISSDPLAPNRGKFIDLAGQKFGRLTPIKYVGKNKHGQSLWLCKCECDKKTTVAGNRLNTGHTKSCGCLNIERITGMGESNKTHGHASDGKISKTYTAWKNMVSRCNNPNDISYKNYGERIPPITVCEKWLPENNGFINFLADMGERPAGLSLDRIDNNLGYYKNNCRWATPKEQGRNKRNNHKLNISGKEKCFAELEEITGIRQETIRSRIKKGFTPEKALTTPVQKRK